MELKNILKDQMATPLWFFIFPPPLIVVLAPLLISVGLILGFGFYSIFLTSITLIFSTLFFTCSKQKPVLLERIVEEKVVLKSDNESASIQDKEVQEASMNNEAPKYLVAAQSSTPDLVVESACLDDLSTSEESEVLDWPFGDNVDRSPIAQTVQSPTRKASSKYPSPTDIMLAMTRKKSPSLVCNRKCQGDANGYDLVVVDAMHKATYASRICHLCRPNYEAKATAVDGRYQIGMYTVRKIQYGEEITLDYNSIKE